ncbi:hypothetical protein AGMMS49992_23420 [Clostridia bacterium]|nr:hypothetical protein AGMMS49992_23420 [Clostridia bacterium]
MKRISALVLVLLMLSGFALAELEESSTVFNLKLMGIVLQDEEKVAEDEDTHFVVPSEEPAPTDTPVTIDVWFDVEGDTVTLGQIVTIRAEVQGLDAGRAYISQWQCNDGTGFVVVAENEDSYSFEVDDASYRWEWVYAITLVEEAAEPAA